MLGMNVGDTGHFFSFLGDEWHSRPFAEVRERPRQDFERRRVPGRDLHDHIEGEPDRNRPDRNPLIEWNAEYGGRRPEE